MRENLDFAVHSQRMAVQRPYYFGFIVVQNLN